VQQERKSTTAEIGARKQDGKGKALLAATDEVME